MLFPSDKITKGMFSGKAMCHYEFLKQEVESNDFSRINKFFNQLISYRSIPRQKVLFTFAGYDDDECQLISIPEVTKYTKELLKKHPYFWYYSTTYSSEFFYLAALLDESNYTIILNDNTKTFKTKNEPERVKEFVRQMGAGLEAFGKRIKDIDGSIMSFKIWSELIVRITT